MIDDEIITSSMPDTENDNDSASESINTDNIREGVIWSEILNRKY